MPKPKKHKRKGPKNTRSGCLMCKPHKMNGFGREKNKFSVRKQLVEEE
jgi:hypothetical protein